MFKVGNSYIRSDYIGYSFQPFLIQITFMERVKQWDLKVQSTYTVRYIFHQTA